MKIENYLIMYEYLCSISFFLSVNIRMTVQPNTLAALCQLAI